MKTLKLTDIRIDGGTQQRAEINQSVVDSYAEALTDGAVFPPAVVFHDGSDHWLSAGFHRYFGFKKAEKEEMPVEIRTGTIKDAILYAVGDNHDHGLPRSSADKEKAVCTLLNDEDWGQRSSRWIAEQAKVGHPFVEKVRKKHQSEPTGIDSSCNENPDEQNNTEPTTRARSSTMGTRRTGRDGSTRTSTTKKPAETIQEWADAGKIGKSARNELMELSAAKQKAFIAAVNGGATPQDALKSISREPGDDRPSRNRSGSSSNGKPVFDDREVESLIGKLARIFLARSEVYGNNDGYRDVNGQLELLIKSWKRWQLETTGGRKK